MKQRGENIILIGMSGAGKSTLGVLLAKALGKNFFDTDLLLQQTEGCLLQETIDRKGVEYFMSLEERAISKLKLRGCVIATGGSVVYSKRGMEHLRRSGRVVYLRVSFEELSGRLSNITTRGIVFKGAGDLRAVYEERLPLYERYADLTVDCTGHSVEDSVRAIVSALEEKKQAETTK